MAPPRVSICIPTFNGARHLERLLPALAAQRLGAGPPALAAGALEVRAVDSSSTDDTRALLERFGAAVEVIPQAQFRHGATRNKIAEQAQGELLVFLSQDALPEGERFVEALVAPFEDPRTAGVSARVLPHEDDDPLTRRTVLAQPEAGEVAQSFDLDGIEGLWCLPEERRLDVLAFNDVASAMRADVFRELPFPDVSFGEDVAWAARALTAGWRLRFAPAAVVRHAHRYTAAQAFARYRTDARFRRDVLGQRVRPSLYSVARGISFEITQDLRFLARGPQPGRWRALCRSAVLRSAQVFGQYVGARAR